MEINFSLSFFEQIKVLLVALLMWAIIFALLKTKSPFDDDKINATIAFLSAIIVSLSGVVGYVITYSSSIFGIILFISFLVIIIMSFLGIKIEDLKINPKIIGGVIGVIFLVVLIKGFFGINNEFMVENYNNPEFDSKQVNTNPNLGYGEIDTSSGFGIIDKIKSMDSDLISAIFFLLIIGVFVMLLK